MHLDSSVGAFPKTMYRHASRSPGFLGISEDDVRILAEKFEDLYREVVAREGGVLSITTNWEDNAVNARATRVNNNWNIAIAGGLARDVEMNKDLLAFLICHELGHHLAGDPKMSLYGGWASAEGQADYWGANICLKKFFHKFYEYQDFGTGLPLKAMRDCNNAHQTLEEKNVCLRTMQAVARFGKFLDKLDPKKIPISFETPDTRVVKGTNINDYPRPQCRFDTIYAAALCSVGLSELTGDLNLGVGNCQDSARLGVRPRCWFKAP